MIIKKSFVPFTLVAICLFAISNAAAQDSQHQVTVTVKPSQTVEEKVANEIKEKELRRIAEEKLAAEKSAQIAETSPKSLLRKARTFFVSSDTSFFEPIQLQAALRKRDEFVNWEMAIIDGWNNREVADVHIEIDRPLFTYTFTYQLTDRSRGIVLATGKITAFDGNAAAPQLAAKIVEEIKKARGESTEKK